MLACGVVAMHIAYFAHIKWTPLFHWVADFLAISGFLLPQSFLQSRSWGHFAWKRFVRVFPGFATSFALVVTLFGLGAIWPTFLTYITAGAYSAGKNGPLWTLATEEAVYVFLAVSMLTGIFRKRFNWITLAVLAFVLIAPVPMPLFGKNMLGLMLGFTVGNLAYHYADLVSRVPLWAGIGVLAFALCCRALGGLEFVPLFPLEGMGIIVIGLKGPAFPRWMPDLSYGVYVYHWPLILSAMVAGVLPVAAIPLLAVKVLGLSLASWFLIEKQALRLKDRFIQTCQATAPLPLKPQPQSAGL